MPGGLHRVLFVDLARHRSWVENREDLFSERLGGAGVAIELLHEHCPESCDPLAPENPIVLAVGPLTSLYPLASKTVAMFKSPHTGNLGESHCGGRSAMALRLAGYGAMVIVGRSPSPVYLSVDADGVRFRDARTLWGMSSSLTAGRVMLEREGGVGHRTVLRIGPAGENLVTYAGVTVETYRHFGRLGMGAVMGSKHLKGIVIAGDGDLPVADHGAYQKTYRDLYTRAVRSPAMRKYYELGTPENLGPLSAMGALPVRNLQATGYGEAPPLEGEALAREHLGRRLACSHCPTACIHLAALREPHPEAPYFYKTTFVSYDYEPLYALGTMLGVERPQDALHLLDAVEHLGLDAMSAGVVLAWATEAFERGLLDVEETGGLHPTWGDAGVYGAMLERIAHRASRLYTLLGKGVDAAATEYGGIDYALSFGRLEMPGYHTGPGAHLTHLTGARHSHLDSAGYSLDQKDMKAGQSRSPEELARALLTEEAYRQVLSSLVVCFFARGLYDADTCVACLSAAEKDRPWDELMALGEDILRRKHTFKVREGFDFDALRIPARALETPTPLGKLSEESLRQAVSEAERLLASGERFSGT